MRFYKGNERYDVIKDMVDICLCHKDYNHCIQNNEGNVIPELSPEDEISTLNITAHTEKALEKLSKRPTTTTTTEAPEVIEAMGFTVTPENFPDFCFNSICTGTYRRGGYNLSSTAKYDVHCWGTG